MGRFYSDAQRHVEKIEHFYKHAGFAGYSQALYHWNELSSLYARSAKSKSNKSDANLIHGLIEQYNSMMTEMKAKADDYANAKPDDEQTDEPERE